MRPFSLKLAAMAAICLMSNVLALQAQEVVKEKGVLNSTSSGQSIFEIRGSKNLGGAIQIVSRQSEEIKVTFEKSARTDSKTKSSRMLELIDLKLNVDDDRAVLEILSPSHAPWEGSEYGIHLELLVEIPSVMRIEGRSDFMKIDIEGPFQGVDLSTTFTSLEIDRIYGYVGLKTSFGNVQLNSIKGEISVEAQNGKIELSDIRIPTGYAVLQASNAPIKLSNIRGPVEAYTSFAAINASDISAYEGSVVLRTSNGAISAENITSELICETSYSPITIKNSKISHGHSRIQTNFAAITADFSEISNSQLYIENEYSNIDLSIPQTVSARLIANVGSGGRIHTSGLRLKPTAIDNSRLEAILGDGESRIELNVDGIGNINLVGQ